MFGCRHKLASEEQIGGLKSKRKTASWFATACRRLSAVRRQTGGEGERSVRFDQPRV